MNCFDLQVTAITLTFNLHPPPPTHTHTHTDFHPQIALFPENVPHNTTYITQL